MKRIYDTLIHDHLRNMRQMVFLAGPRQVGKTTCSLSTKALTNNFHYLNWDNRDQQKIIIKGPLSVAQTIALEKAQKKKGIVIFDEIHKFKKWKQFLKGFFDTYSDRVKIIVTGSAKLNLYRRIGDSLMGRYFLYRMHPLSVAELLTTQLIKKEIRAPQKLPNNKFKSLFKYGGFPEPYIKHNANFHNRWLQLRQQQLIHEDIRALSQIQELPQLEMLSDVLKRQAGQLVNYSSLANMINVSAPTVQRWINNLESFYYIFTVKPWSKNVKRSLKKGPKVYLWDWSIVDDAGKRVENFVASHLLKAIHFWTDCGFGKYDLYFLRDKEKREVDFIVTKNNVPWFLVEVKHSENHSISKHLYYFQKQTKAAHAFQVVFNASYVDVDCFKYKKPTIVPAITFLSQLI